MKRICLILAMLVRPFAAAGDDRKPMIAGIVDGHILPWFDTLALRVRQLAEASARDCSASFGQLRAAYARHSMHGQPQAA